jgi:hypothetical protein
MCLQSQESWFTATLERATGTCSNHVLPVSSCQCQWPEGPASLTLPAGRTQCPARARHQQSAKCINCIIMHLMDLSKIYVIYVFFQLASILHSMVVICMRHCWCLAESWFPCAWRCPGARPKDRQNLKYIGTVQSHSSRWYNLIVFISFLHLLRFVQIRF